MTQSHVETGQAAEALKELHSSLDVVLDLVGDVQAPYLDRFWAAWERAAAVLRGLDAR